MKRLSSYLLKRKDRNSLVTEFLEEGKGDE